MTDNLPFKKIEKSIENQMAALCSVSETIKEASQMLLLECGTLQKLANEIKDWSHGSIDTAVQDKIEASIKQLESAAASSKYAINRAKDNFEQATKINSLKRGIFVAGFFAASILTGIGCFYTFTWQSHELSSEQKSDIFTGKKLKLVWPKLSKSEQDKIAELMRCEGKT